MKKIQAKVNGKAQVFRMDMAALLEYGQLIGVDDVNQIQIKMNSVLQGISGEGGKVLISSVEAVSKLAFVAARTGAIYNEKELNITDRDMLNALLSDEGGDIVMAIVEAINQLNGGGLAKKKKAQAQKKS